jgi:hypothetical protein
MCIQTIEGLENIVDITESIEYGIYTIVTNEEYVVINEVIASPFSVNHYITNTYYNIHRFVYSLFPYKKNSLLQNVNEIMTGIVDKFILKFWF